ncbi:hypothetical protein ES705_44041 [subsurface metagenome]
MMYSYWYVVVTALVVFGIIVYSIKKEKRKGNK